jgi:hypothetical protein
MHDGVRTFAPLVEGLSSGPPALRIRQLAALARADVVRFLGPDPVPCVVHGLQQRRDVAPDLVGRGHRLEHDARPVRLGGHPPGTTSSCARSRRWSRA